MDYRRIEEDLLKKGILLMNGKIGKETYEKFRDAFRYFISEDISNIEIRIESYGGSYYFALLICSIIEEFKGKVRGVVTGYASSAAFTILQKCDERVIYERAILNIHEIASIFSSRLTATYIHKLLYEEKSKVRQEWISMLNKNKKDDEAKSKFYSSRSGKISQEEVYNIMLEDRDMFSDEALRLGFVDKIISNFWKEKLWNI